MSWDDVGQNGGQSVGQDPQDGDPQVARWRDGLAALAETAVPRGDCPEPDRIWAAVDGELAPDELRDVVDHTAGCVVCAEAWQLAAELGDADAAIEQEPSHRSMFWRSWTQVAAMVVVLAGAAFVMQKIGPRPDLPLSPSPDVVRNGDVVRSGDEVQLLARTPADEPQSRDDLVLDWAYRPTALELTFDIELTWETVDRSVPLFQADSLMVSRLRIPPEALAEVPPGVTLLWEVTAFRGDEEVAHKAFPLRLR